MATKRIPEGAAYTASQPKRVTPKRPIRSNAGGAVRGQARAAQVQAMKKPAAQRRLPGPTPTTSATNPPPASIRKAAAMRSMGSTEGLPGAGTPKQGLPPKTIGTGPNPVTPPAPPKVPVRSLPNGPAWLKRTGQMKQAM
jgi:hypothetical protein